MSTGLIVSIVVVVIIVVLIGWGVSAYNNLVTLKNRVKNGWAQIDVQLKQRADLIPNLVNTVKGYASHESEVFTQVTAARAVAVHPQVLLMDEPCSALDPISTLAIEDLIDELKSDYTIVIVTHNMQQAARIADYTAFFNLKAVGQPGHLEYFADTMTMFNNPQDEEAERYISGRFG